MAGQESDSVGLFSVAICFGPNATLWGLTFKTWEAADSVAIAVKDAMETGNILSIADDFGQATCIRGIAISGVLVEDMKATVEAQVLRGVHHARGQAEVQAAAQADPIIRRHMLMSGGGGGGGNGLVAPSGQRFIG